MSAATAHNNHGPVSLAKETPLSLHATLFILNTKLDQVLVDIGQLEAAVKDPENGLIVKVSRKVDDEKLSAVDKRVSRLESSVATISKLAWAAATSGIAAIMVAVVQFLVFTNIGS